MSENIAETATVPASSFPGTLLWERVLEPKGRIAFELSIGQTLRITDLDGQQVADLICFNKNDPAEKISIHTTIMLNGNIHIGTGKMVFSDDARPMLRVGTDTVGRHDLLAGTCCRGLNRLRYGVDDGPNCRSSLAMVMEPYGVTAREIPYTFNVFMNVPVQPNGDIEVVAPISKPGDHIDLTAQMDLIVAISNCPQERNICNGYTATRLGLAIFGPAV